MFFDLFQGVSAAIIFLAAWLIKKYGDITKITTDEYTLVPCGILVGVGVLIFITALFGCCGTCRDNKCCLSTVSLCFSHGRGVLIGNFQLNRERRPSWV